jgi:hypothetical protein
MSTEAEKWNYAWERTQRLQNQVLEARYSGDEANTIFMLSKLRESVEDLMVLADSDSTTDEG